MSMTLPMPASVGADVELVEPFGLPAPVVAGLALVLSHFLGASGVNHSWYLAGLLRRYAHTTARIAGQEFPEPCPEVDVAGRRPTGRVEVERLGLTAHGFKQAWKRHRVMEGADVPLAIEQLVPFVPADLWPVLRALIADGPHVAAARINLVLAREAQRPIRPDRRHADTATARLSQSQLNSYAAAAKSLAGAIVELAHDSATLGPALSAWRRVPELVVPTSEQEPTDSTAPRRWQVRALWQRTQRRVAERLPEGYPDELSATAALGVRDLRYGGLFGPLRLRVLLVLLLVCGLRVGAIARLRVGDFRREWEGPDGEVGPAIASRPRKGKRDEKVSPKPLPPAAAAVIETYLAYMERHLGPLAADGPLLHADTGGRAWQKSSILNLVGGTSSAQRAQKALIPRNGSPHHGFTCHTFRSGSAQMVRSIEAHEWLVAQRVSAPQHYLAEALLDHKMDGLPALYGGASKDRDRERLTAIATDLTWRLLTTDLGARRGPDGQAYRRALHARAALQGELDRLACEVDAAFAEPPRRRRAADADALFERVEALLRAHALVHRERQARDELAAVDRELELLRVDPARQVAIADTADAVPDDLEAVEREVLAGGTAVPRRRGTVERQRQWWSVQEFAGAIGASPATLPRWLGQGGRAPQLPFADGDTRNPWPADRVPVDDSLGPRRRRILADGLSQSWLASDPPRAQRLEELLAQPGPDGWTPEQCAAPPAPPAWMT